MLGQPQALSTASSAPISWVSGWQTQICCVCRGGRRSGVDPFPPAPPALGLGDTSKVLCISHPAARALVPQHW